jgi:hypothetical protein
VLQYDFNVINLKPKSLQQLISGLKYFINEILKIRVSGLKTLPAHAVAYGLHHTYCQEQDNTCERYGKKLFHCVERTIK